MSKVIYESVCLRFTSGNSIPVERARVSPSELKSLVGLSGSLLTKLLKRLEIATWTSHNPIMLGQWQIEIRDIGMKITEAKLRLLPALKRNDGVLRREEGIRLLTAICHADMLQRTMKMVNNSTVGAHAISLSSTYPPR